MNHTWGVYEVRGRLAGGEECPASNRKAVSYFVRWRVDGTKRRRSFKTKGHASTFRDLLLKAKLNGWAADERGWPIDPQLPVAPQPTEPADPEQPLGRTIEQYIDDVWWPTISTTLADKSRLGHRRNADLAVQLLRLQEGDPRIGATSAAGDSIRLASWTSDDTKAALAARRRINGRVAARNRRLLDAAASDPNITEVTLAPEECSPATLRAFKITLGMIAKAAIASGQVSGDPMADTARHAPKPRPSKRRERLVPDLQELFDLADAIAAIGPLMPDGRPRGERFRSLILVAGTTGPRPGELVAHRPEWIDWDSEPAVIRFHRTEAAVYGAVLTAAERGRRERQLKHSDEEESRLVPMIGDVASALREHFDRGYASPSRTWLSPTGRGHLDFGNLVEDYWRPALERVFAGTPKAALLEASPKVLRKTAITWWADRGINQAEAADWAGHSEEVARVFYASRASTTFQREALLLERGK